MRSAVAGFAIVLALGLAAVVALALTQRSSLVYSLGVKPALPAAELSTGDRVCQGPVRVPKGTEFDRVGFVLATVGRPGTAMRVEVLDADTGRRLGAGRLEHGYRDVDPARIVEQNVEQIVDVGHVRTDAPLELCLVDEGPGDVQVVGQADIASPWTIGTMSGRELPTDVTFNLHAEDRSLASLAPDIAERASRFRAGWVTPAVYLLLGIAVLIGAPLLLAQGLKRAEAADHDASPPALDPRSG